MSVPTTVSTAHIRVRYPETDRMGVAHHTHFFVWFEVGRTEYMRDRGCPYSELEKQGLFFPVVEAGARYHRPVRYDEELRVETSLEEVTAARVHFAYRLVRPPAGELLASGFTVHAAVDASGSPRRIPPEVRHRLLACEASE